MIDLIAIYFQNFTVFASGDFRFVCLQKRTDEKRVLVLPQIH